VKDDTVLLGELNLILNAVRCPYVTYMPVTLGVHGQLSSE